MHAARFVGVDATGADFTDVDFEGASLVALKAPRATFAGSDLRGCNMKMAQLQAANLSGCNLSDADLQDANADGASLHSAFLVDANLSRASLQGADLRCVRWYGGSASRIPTFTESERTVSAADLEVLTANNLPPSIIW